MSWGGKEPKYSTELPPRRHKPVPEGPPPSPFSDVPPHLQFTRFDAPWRATFRPSTPMQPPQSEAGLPPGATLSRSGTDRPKVTLEDGRRYEWPSENHTLITHPGNRYREVQSEHLTHLTDGEQQDIRINRLNDGTFTVFKRDAENPTGALGPDYDSRGNLLPD